MKIINKIIAALFNDKKEVIMIESDFDYYDKYIKPKDIQEKVKQNKIIGKIEVWYGTGGYSPLGPIEAEVIGQKDNGELIVKITNEHWLEETDFDFEFSCGKIPSSRYVRNDDYAWCEINESGLQPTKWW